MKKDEIKKTVRERYAGVARSEGSCCGPESSSCGCGGTAAEVGNAIGYSDRELKIAPAGSNLGLGCGNPTALASLRRGETVLDLGAGAGFDCFLAAGEVGPEGRVIGVDMTPEMVDKARGNARDSGADNVEFRLGEIENIPVADGTVDVVISNCVINLSPDKERVFREALRTLKPGGRIMVSDIVLERPLPDFIRNSVEAYAGCIAGAALKSDYLDAIRKAGFEAIETLGESPVPFDLMANDPNIRSMLESLDIPAEEAKRLAGSVTSVKVRARKARDEPRPHPAKP